MFMLASMFLGLVVITKLMDLFSTLKCVRPEQEKNPLAQLLMKKTGMGFRRVLYVITALAFIIVVVVWTEMYFIRIVYYEIVVVLLSAIVSYFQYGAYINNSKRKTIPGIRFFLKSRYYSQR